MLACWADAQDEGPAWRVRLGRPKRPMAGSKWSPDGALHCSPAWSRVKGLCARLSEPVGRRNLFADDYRPDAAVQSILGSSAGRHSSAHLLSGSALVIAGVGPIGDRCPRSERVVWSIDGLCCGFTPRCVSVSRLARSVPADLGRFPGCRLVCSRGALLCTPSAAVDV